MLFLIGTPVFAATMLLNSPGLTVGNKNIIRPRDQLGLVTPQIPSGKWNLEVEFYNEIKRVELDVSQLKACEGSAFVITNDSGNGYGLNFGFSTIYSDREIGMTVFIALNKKMYSGSLVGDVDSLILAGPIEDENKNSFRAKLVYQPNSRSDWTMTFAKFRSQALPIFFENQYWYSDVEASGGLVLTHPKVKDFGYCYHPNSFITSYAHGGAYAVTYSHPVATDSQLVSFVTAGLIESKKGTLFAAFADFDSTKTSFLIENVGTKK